MKEVITKYNWLAILSVFGLVIVMVLNETGFVDKQEPGVYVQIVVILFSLIVVPYTFCLFYDCLTNPAVDPKIGWVVMFLLFVPIAAIFYSMSAAFKERLSMSEQIES